MMGRLLLQDSRKKSTARYVTICTTCRSVTYLLTYLLTIYTRFVLETRTLSLLDDLRYLYNLCRWTNANNRALPTVAIRRT